MKYLYKIQWTETVDEVFEAEVESKTPPEEINNDWNLYFLVRNPKCVDKYFGDAYDLKIIEVNGKKYEENTTSTNS